MWARPLPAERPPAIQKKSSGSKHNRKGQVSCLSWCHLPRGTTLQNSQIFRQSRLCAAASSWLGLFTEASKAGFGFWDANLVFPIPSAPFPPPGFRPSFSGVSLNQKGIGMCQRG